jgi:hypothetical protein
MNISPNEAEEALADIQRMTQKTRQSIAGSGAHIFLIATGIVWLVGFIATQFLSGFIVPTIWIGMSVIGSAVAVFLGTRMSRRVRNPSANPTAKRAAFFWVILIFFCIATIAVTKPADPKQVTMIIIMYVMLGQLAMGLLVSFSYTWWALPITALALVGYFLVPDFFYLWMGVLVGGSMVALGLFIRLRW